jgi:hypothetical protein
VYSSLKDGGVVDRIGLKAWRDRRRRQSLGGPLSVHARTAVRASRPPPALIHIIERSSPFSGADNPAATGEADVHVVRSPKSGVNFFDLGNFDQQFDAARRRARPVLEQLVIAPSLPAGMTLGVPHSAGGAPVVVGSSGSSRGAPAAPAQVPAGSSRGGPVAVVARTVNSSGGGGGGASRAGGDSRLIS